jgi:hypothetical protein
MKELLNKLLSTDILTESTKTELEAAFTTKLDEAMAQAKSDATAQVTAELNEQWIAERETLINVLDVKITEALTVEMSELREDIERFRDLEAEYAEKLVEAEQSMADTLTSDLAKLVEKLDAFLEVRLTAELNELREDIQLVKRNEFGRNIFEAFVAEFKQNYAGDNSLEAKLSEAEQQLQDTTAALIESERKSAALARKIKLEKVLAPLSGKTKEVMEAILKNVDTPLLEEAYSTYVSRVLKDTTVPVVTKVLKESETTAPVVTGISKSGNVEESLTESVKVKTQADVDLSFLRAVAGIV